MPNIVLVQNDYPDQGSLSRVINYITKSDIIGGYAVDPYHAFRQMEMVKSAFHKNGGIQLKHFFITFSLDEALRIDLDQVLDLGFQVGRLFQEYQLVYAVHLDGSHLHLHCVMNAVSFLDGHKYSDGLAGFWKLKTMLNQKFPKSDIGLYRSYPNSEYNTYSFTSDDTLLRID